MDFNDSPQRDVPAIPRRPSEAKPRRSAWSIVLAGFFAVLLFGGICLLSAPLVGVAIGAAMIVGGLCLVAFLHYIVWGYWLGDAIRREVEEEEEEERADKDP